MTDTTLPVPLPPVKAADVYKHFGNKIGHPLLTTVWKDSIDIEKPTYALQNFAESYARACMAPLQEENAKLKTVMIAAAEEIAAHWAGHCDAEGYGPVNLLHRLEEGIPSEYGYTAGAFKTLQERADALEEALRELVNACPVHKMSDPEFIVWTKARSLINPTGGES